MTKPILWLAAAVAVLGAMMTGRASGFIWLAAVVAALIMVRRTWPDTKTKNTD